MDQGAVIHWILVHGSAEKETHHPEPKAGKSHTMELEVPGLHGMLRSFQKEWKAQLWCFGCDAPPHFS